jgi:zinc transporter
VNATSYEADAAGLICGFLLGPGWKPRAVDAAQVADWLTTDPAAPDAHEGGGFAWIHFNLAHTGALPWLESHASLSPGFYDMLRDGLRSTRIERTDEALTAVVNDVRFDFSFEPSDISTLWIDVERRLVVTARQRPLRSVDKLRQAVREGQPVRSPAALLANLLRMQADVLVEIVRTVTERIDDIEDQLLSKRLEHRRARLGVLRRLLVRLQRLLAPEPAAFFRLLQHPPHWIDDVDLQDLRQSSEEFSVVLRDMASLQERIKLLQEEVAAEVNESNNRSLFVLTIVTVLALPINIIAGLMGMNVGGVPLAQHPHGFWIVAGVVVSSTVLAGLVVVRRRRTD